jgi:L-ascorbate metabolism protein UlaG (beta-lactamase superfamily)
MQYRTLVCLVHWKQEIDLVFASCEHGDHVRQHLYERVANGAPILMGHVYS